jgi:hypothetical protein
VRSLYPNAWADVYPDEVLGASDARPYSGALGIENPISRGRVTPVLDQMAEGWGTMTVKPDQHALGKGVWRNGVWRVVITRPMVSDDLNAPRLLPGAGPWPRSRCGTAAIGRLARAGVGSGAAVIQR